jgi:hypothetical protein
MSDKPVCEPPPAYRERRWHWLRNEDDEDAWPFEWLVDCKQWWHSGLGESCSPEHMAGWKYTYWAPIEDPPAERVVE